MRILPALPGAHTECPTGVKGAGIMDVVHPRCAGVDVSKRDAKVCVRIAGAGRRKTVATVTTWGSMTNQVLALRDHLRDQQVTLVVMEATGDFWKPFYYVLEDDFEVMLVNPRHVKNLPGRKPTSRMRHGWPIWVRTGWCAGRWCRRNRSVSCGI